MSYRQSFLKTLAVNCTSYLAIPHDRMSSSSRYKGAAMIMDVATQTEIIKRLSERLTACYIFPDVAEQICARLQEHLAAGDYADIVEGEFFALALTFHMQEINHDEHLWVRWHAEPLPDGDGPLRLNQEWQDERRLEARLDNYGLYKVERLPGNVGISISIISTARPGAGTPPWRR